MSTIERYRAKLRTVLGEDNPKLAEVDRLLIDAMSEAHSDGVADAADESGE